MRKKFLAVDYGLKKIGLAQTVVEEDNPGKAIAEPYKVIRFETINEAVEKIVNIVESEKFDQIVLGISEGEMAEQTIEFGELLKEKINTLIETQDESLTTQEAQRLSIEAGIKRKKRKNMEDAYSAALILQSYIDKMVKI